MCQSSCLLVLSKSTHAANDYVNYVFFKKKTHLGKSVNNQKSMVLGNAWVFEESSQHSSLPVCLLVGYNDQITHRDIFSERMAIGKKKFIHLITVKAEKKGNLRRH